MLKIIENCIKKFDLGSYMEKIKGIDHCLVVVTKSSVKINIISTLTALI